MAKQVRTAVEQAVALLAGRPKSRAALAAALSQRGYPEAEVDAALEQVSRWGYLDDARVALARAMKELPEGRARQQVAQRLEAVGIAPEVARRAVDHAAAELGLTEEAAARLALSKKRKTGLEAARYLASRGFDEDLAARLAGVDEVPDGG
ncbi:MAG: RecX family transcriptional regulator [Myxococcaceae bacterium]|nr:RecX family transcriptional regulator [Myxococcaceae bacterium]